MKLQAPKLPNRADLTPCDATQLMSETALESIRLQGVDASNLPIQSLSIDEAILEKVIFSGATLDRFSLSDAELLGCDFTATHCPGASLIRMQVTGGRLTGIDLSRSTLKDIIFDGCKLDMANFRYAKLTRVTFVDCLLTETDFQAAELSEVTFQSSILDRVEFGHCKVKMSDARTSQLLDIRGWEYLKGITIDSLQLMAVAPQLALEIGITIKD
ncbi:MAG TPA: pentapeptide repeat-containing protein [Patescibacteria group bacterium]|nr:pentapeptide repeat-containing protein [Patescibacteria group bacterium]